MPGERSTIRPESGDVVGSARTLPAASSPENLTVEVLLRATARGDADAFERLYRTTSARLYAIVLRIVKRHEAADDVLQDTYIRIWKHAATQRGPQGSAFGWMVSIARNRALDWLRSQRNDQPYDEQRAAAEIDESADIEALADASEEARALRRCLQKLEEAQRRCIMLAFLDGYTHQELAERLQAPLGSIKSWIRRGQIRLKDCLSA